MESAATTTGLVGTEALYAFGSPSSANRSDSI
jgi:hypothetical protein